MNLFESFKRRAYHSKSEYTFYLLVSFLWALPTINNFGVVWIGRILGLGDLKYAIVPTVSILLSLLSLNFFKTKIKARDIIIYLIVIALYCINFIIYPDNSEVLAQYMPAFLIAYLWLFVGLTLDFDKIKKPLHIVSAINILLSGFYYMFLSQSTGYKGVDFSETSHLGSVSYEILPSVIWFVWCLLKSVRLFHLGTIVNLLFSIFGFILISSFGTRGPLVCLIAFITFYIFFFSNYKHKRVIRSITILLAVLAYSILDYILLFMVELTTSLGMSSRIFSFALEGTFSGGEASSDERVTLLNTLKLELGQNNIEKYIGHGFLGWGTFIDQYPHNLYFDAIFCFGYIFGSVFLLYLLYLFYKAYKCDSSTARDFVLIVSMIGIIQLFMSGTFWATSFFYLFIGCCINIIRSNRYKSTSI